MESTNKRVREDPSSTEPKKRLRVVDVFSKDVILVFCRLFERSSTYQTSKEVCGRISKEIEAIWRKPENGELQTNLKKLWKIEKLSILVNLFGSRWKWNIGGQFLFAILLQMIKLDTTKSDKKSALVEMLQICFAKIKNLDNLAEFKPFLMNRLVEVVDADENLILQYDLVMTKFYESGKESLNEMKIQEAYNNKLHLDVIANALSTTSSLLTHLKKDSLYKRDLFYGLIPFVIELLNLYVQKKLTETVAVFASELISTVCDLAYSRTMFSDTKTPLGTVVMENRNEIIHVLLKVVEYEGDIYNKDEHDEDGDPALCDTAYASCSTSIGLVARVIGSKLRESEIIHFLQKNLNEYSNLRESAALLLGSLQEGIHRESVVELNKKYFSILCKLANDPNVAVRDTAMWTIGGILSNHPSCINDRYIESLFDLVLNRCFDRPRVASNAHWAFTRYLNSIENRENLISKDQIQSALSRLTSQFVISFNYDVHMSGRSSDRITAGIEALGRVIKTAALMGCEVNEIWNLIPLRLLETIQMPLPPSKFNVISIKEQCFRVIMSQGSHESKIGMSPDLRDEFENYVSVQKRVRYSYQSGIFEILAYLLEESPLSTITSSNAEQLMDVCLKAITIHKIPDFVGDINQLPDHHDMLSTTALLCLRVITALLHIEGIEYDKFASNLINWSLSLLGSNHDEIMLIVIEEVLTEICNISPTCLGKYLDEVLPALFGIISNRDSPRNARPPLLILFGNLIRLFPNKMEQTYQSVLGVVYGAVKYLKGGNNQIEGLFYDDLNCGICCCIEAIMKEYSGNTLTGSFLQLLSEEDGWLHRLYKIGYTNLHQNILSTANRLANFVLNFVEKDMHQAYLQKDYFVSALQVTI